MNFDPAVTELGPAQQWSVRQSSHSWFESSAVSVAVLCVLAVLLAVHATALAGQVLYPVTVLAAAVTTAIGVRIHRAQVLWPWMMLGVAGTLWTVAGVTRTAFSATGDLTTNRSLIPDVFALPGYVAFGVGLWGLIHVHGRDTDRSALVDACVVAAGSVTIVFSLIVAPTMNIADAAMTARVSVSVYPTISMFLLVGAAQLAFTHRRRHAEGLVLFVAGTACLSLGDVVFALGETGAIAVPRNMLDLPFLGVATFCGAAALHPDTHRVRHRTIIDHAPHAVSRLMAVAFAFVAPIVAVAFPADGVARAFQIGACVVVTLVAVWRIALASRSESQSRQKLIRRATHDALTGLPSREFIIDELAARVENRRRVSTTVMFLDLDGFKRVNDSLGHAAGDRLLVLVAQRLTDTVRDGDIVGRIGGDEFVVVCTELDSDRARALGDRIRHALREPFNIDASEVHVAASVGITLATYGDDAETVMREADTAMYESKGHGRNRTTMFDTEMRHRIAERISIEAGLRQALDNDEITVVFQPIVDAVANRVEGFEALMRWNSPSGPRSPAQFIPVAEDTGLIAPMGAWMLDEACRQLTHWRRTIDSSLTVSVNVSVTQVHTTRFVDDVAACLERHHLPGEALWLEIVETVMLEDSVQTAAVLMALRSLGVRLAVDDFGTGYASLTYLRQFPVSRLKIDRSFVADMSNAQTSGSLVASVVSLAHDTGLDVVAEGVETREQLRLLTEMGCTLIQGFVHSPGVPAAQVPQVVDDIADCHSGPHEPAGVSYRQVGRRAVRCRP